MVPSERGRDDDLSYPPATGLQVALAGQKLPMTSGRFAAKLPAMTNRFLKTPPVDEASLVCRIGDRLTVHEAALTQEGEKVEVGSVYEVAARAQYAWILRLVHGSGAPELRILNSTLLATLTPGIAAKGSFEDANRGS